MGKLAWYKARLKQMQPAEIAWRIGSAARVPADYLDMKRAQSPKRYQPSGEWWKAQEYPVAFHREGGSFDEIRIFDLQFPANFAFDWHRDYLHGKTAPRRFSRRLDTRDPQVVGDIKYIWEPSRHQHLSAIAYSNRHDAESIVSTAVESWITDNPFLTGVNWTSILELATRLISWALLFPILKPRLEKDAGFRQSFAASVYQHLSTIRKNLSLYSSANNHLLGELTGLYVGAVCFAWWPECRSWRKFALDSLEREAGLQFTPEGINREQAMSYQIFTLELLLLAELIAQNSGDTVGPTLRQRTQAGLLYLDKVATPSGDLPWYGDSDDARGFVLSEHESGFEVVMQLGALLFDEPGLAGRSPRLTAAAQALVPGAEAKLAQLMSRRISRGTGSGLLRDGGIAVVGGSDCKVVMDVGALGYTNIAAHGHADALSVLLSAGDEYLVVDSGTYSYHSNQEWRSYFRGTAAHNTVRIDGTNQSTIAGRFLWSSKANVRLIDFKETNQMALVSAEHDGYERLADPVVHRRNVMLDKRRQILTVEDVLTCNAEHEIEVHWHLSERAELTRESDQSVRAEIDGKVVSFGFQGEGFRLDIVKGSVDPILGWRSPAFNQKVAIATLRFSGQITGKTSITTSIRVAEAASDPVEAIASQATHA